MILDILSSLSFFCFSLRTHTPTPICLHWPFLACWVIFEELSWKGQCNRGKFQILASDKVCSPVHQRPLLEEASWRRHPAFFSEWEHLAFLSLSLCIRTRIPKQGLSICLLQWKHRVLTTGLPGKSHLFFYGAILRIYLSIYLIIKFQLHWDTVMTKRCVKTSPNI